MPPPTIPNCHLWLKDEVKYQEIWVNCFDPCYFRNHRPILLTDLWVRFIFRTLYHRHKQIYSIFFFSHKWAYRKIKRRNTYMFHCYCWKEINCLGHKCRHVCALTLHWISWKCHAIIEQISPFSNVFAWQRRDFIQLRVNSIQDPFLPGLFSPAGRRTAIWCHWKPTQTHFSILTSAGEYSYHLLQRYISFQYSGVFIHSSIKSRYQLSSVVSQG